MKTFNISAKQWERAIYVAIFVIGIILRLSLAFVNREANDQHMEVVQWILTHNDLPIQTDDNCWECFQPKLYYFTTAVFLRGFSINNPDTQIIIAQLLNSLLGIVMLGYAYFLIQHLQFGRVLKLLAFGLITLNPGLVGINVQATNDTFAISFSFIAIYYAFRLVTSTTTQLATSRQNKLDFVLLILFASLAILAKTNAIVTAVAILIAFLIKAVTHQSAIFYRRSLLFLLTTSCLVIFNPLSQYIINYQTFGTPITLTINIPKQPIPHIFEKTDTHRPGILSIQDGFFTFRIVELIREPQINRSNKNYPIHRTSFWTILYGRTHFIQYNQWPQSWMTTSTIIQQLGRLIYLFALLPSLAFVVGLGSEFLILFKPSHFEPQPNNKRDLQPTPSLFSAFHLNLNAFNGAGLFFALTLGYLGFQILYALQYRIYTVIKAIFIYPAWPAILFFYLAGAQILHQQTRRFPWIFYIFIISNTVLIGLYTLDSLALLLQLTH